VGCPPRVFGYGASAEGKEAGFLLAVTDQVVSLQAGGNVGFAEADSQFARGGRVPVADVEVRSQSGLLLSRCASAGRRSAGCCGQARALRAPVGEGVCRFQVGRRLAV
jgi:hypothetical protein